MSASTCNWPRPALTRNAPLAAPGVFTTAIIALDLALPLWLSALVVTVVLFLAAGIAAMMGKKQVWKATPPTPEKAIAGVKEDVEAVKGRHA